MKPLFESVYASLPRQNAGTTAAASTSAARGAISDRIEQAFDTASASTGTSFDYLVKTAQRESSMNPTAKAKTSSATGLFQFIESTWLETLKTSGAELGLGDIADQITAGPNGRYRVEDPEAREQILALRNDPEIASLMAGALTRRNAGYLESAIGREASAGELYIAHFLGAKGAASLINAASGSPDASAAEMFPRQASANKSIFYEKGKARSVAEVYSELVRNHGGSDAPATAEEAVMTAYADTREDAVPSAALALDDPAARVRSGWHAAAPSDAFSALFRTDAPVDRPMAAAAFWRGYSMAPGLFDVAVAEDTRQLAAEEAKAATDAAAAASPSIAARAAAPRRSGPLDLSQFLDTDG